MPSHAASVACTLPLITEPCGRQEREAAGEVRAESF